MIDNLSIFSYKNSPAKSLGVIFHLFLDLSLVSDKRDLKIACVRWWKRDVFFRVIIEINLQIEDRNKKDNNKADTKNWLH